MVQLSVKAKELIPKAKIISFKSWQKTHPEELIAILISADNDRAYLSMSFVFKKLSGLKIRTILTLNWSDL